MRRRSPLLGTFPGAGRRAGWPGGLRADPQHPLPPAAAASSGSAVESVQACARKKAARWAGAPKEQGTHNGRLARATGFLLLGILHGPQSRGKEGVLSRALRGALGGSC